MKTVFLTSGPDFFKTVEAKVIIITRYDKPNEAMTKVNVDL